MHQANKWTSNRACALKELWNAFNVVFIKIQRQQLQERNPTKCQNLIYVLSFWSKNCQTVFSCCYNLAIIVVRPEISSQCCQKQTRGMCVQPCSSPSRRPGFVNCRSAVEEDLKSSASSAQPRTMNGPLEIKTLTIWKHFDWVAKQTGFQILHTAPICHYNSFVKTAEYMKNCAYMLFFHILLSDQLVTWALLWRKLT